jgi:oligoendopeptidase F
MWLALEKRFGHDVSWEGDEDFRDRNWQRQLHLFGYPFYYIEYGIAQIGAMQMWVKALENESAAIAGYQAGLKLGGSRPLPELFEAAGLKFDFGAATIGGLIDRVGEALAELPE